MLLQSSPPPFPQVPLEPGKTWSTKPARLPLPLGTLVLDRTFTFQGPDPKIPKLLLIGIETKVTLEPGGRTSRPRSGSRKGRGA